MLAVNAAILNCVVSLGQFPDSGLDTEENILLQLTTQLGHVDLDPASAATHAIIPYTSYSDMLRSSLPAAGDTLSESSLLKFSRAIEEGSVGNAQFLALAAEPDLDTIVAGIRQFTVQILDDSHSTDEASAISLAGVITACATDSSMVQQSINDLLASFRSERIEHQECRVKQKTALVGSTTACTLFEEFKSSAWSTPNWTPVIEPQTCFTSLSTDKDALGVLIEGNLRLAKWQFTQGARYVELYEACQTSTREHEDYSMECKREQSQFEMDFCSWHIADELQCETHVSCDEDARADQITKCSEIGDRVTTRTYFCQRSDELICSLSNMVSHAENPDVAIDIPAMLAECKAAAETSTCATTYGIECPPTVPPPPPTPSPCTQGDKPGGQAWWVKEYAYDTGNLYLDLSDDTRLEPDPSDGTSWMPQPYQANSDSLECDGSRGGQGDTDCGNSQYMVCGAAKCACFDCPTGQHQSLGGTDCQCPVGFFYDGDGCSDCGAGTQPNPAKDACDPCPPGTFSTADPGNICSLCSSGMVPTETRDSCVNCGPNEVSGSIGICSLCAGGTAPNSVNSQCGPCAAGTYSDGTECQQCAAGQEANLAQISCDDCGANEVSDGASSCHECEAGSSPNAAASVCVPDGGGCADQVVFGAGGSYAAISSYSTHAQFLTTEGKLETVCSITNRRPEDADFDVGCRSILNDISDVFADETLSFFAAGGGPSTMNCGLRASDHKPVCKHMIHQWDDIEANTPDIAMTYMGVSLGYAVALDVDGQVHVWDSGYTGSKFNEAQVPANLGNAIATHLSVSQTGDWCVIAGLNKQITCAGPNAQGLMDNQPVETDGWLALQVAQQMMCAIRVRDEKIACWTSRTTECAQAHFVGCAHFSGPNPEDLPAALSIHGDYYSDMCAHLKDGSVACWGRKMNTKSSLESGGLAVGRVQSLRVGGKSACALTVDGTFRCWGGVEIGRAHV